MEESEEDGEAKRITFNTDIEDDDKQANGTAKNITISPTKDTPVSFFDKVQETPTTKDPRKANGLFSQKELSSTPVSKILTGTTVKNDISIAEKVKPRGIIGDDISFTDDGYYMTPSLETLSSMTLLQLRKVSGLTIGHRDYGKIEFLEPVDLSNISLPALCGQLVVFQPKTCSVYANSTNKPEKGEGLNVRARISTSGCYPINKSNREPIKDPNHPILKRHVEKMKAIPGVKFESYDPQSGTWVFTVDHTVA